MRGKPSSVIIALLVLGLFVFVAPITVSALKPSAPTSHSQVNEGKPVISYAPIVNGKGCSGGAPESGCETGQANMQGQLTWHSGPVMHNVTDYLIFWEPTGYSYDNPTANPSSVNASDAYYESVIEKYFQDVGNTTFYGILQQYKDGSGSPGVTLKLGGVYFDSTPYPGGNGTVSSGLSPTNLWNEVISVQHKTGWTNGSGNNEFFVYTPLGVYGEDQGKEGYCAYHGGFFPGITWSPGEPYTNIAFMPDSKDPVGAGGFCITAQTKTPNNDVIADFEVSLTAHEQFEAISDPVAYNTTDTNWYGGWFNQFPNGGEVGDECAYVFGPESSNGGDVVLHGDSFLVQEMWNNAVAGCSLAGGFTPTATSVTLSRQSGTSSPLAGSNAFKVSYVKNGENAIAYATDGTLSLSPDKGSSFTILGTSTGSNSSEEWVFDSAQTPMSFRAGADVSLVYYDLLAQSPSYSILGGGAPAAPTLTYSSAPEVSSSSYQNNTITITLSESASPSIWGLRNTIWNVNLPASGASEEWRPLVTSGKVSSSDSIPSPIDFYHQYNVQLGFDVSGGGSGYSSPGVTCSQLGAETAVGLGSAVWVDAGTNCNFTSMLPGSTPSERWAVKTATFSVSGPGSLLATYFHQYDLIAGYQVVGGGAPAVPQLTGTAFGTMASVPLATVETAEWLDAGSAYSVENSLPPSSGANPGSTGAERWYTSSTTAGTLSGSATLDPSYVHQYLLSVVLSIAGGGSPAPPTFSFISLGQSGSVQLTNASRSLWADAGTSYSVAPRVISSASHERWSLTSASGTVTTQGEVPVSYLHEYLISFELKDNSLSRSLTGASLKIQLSNQSTVEVPNLQIWLPDGTSFQLSSINWQGEDVTPGVLPTNSVTGPLNVTFAGLAYPAAVTVHDYLGLPVSGAQVVFTLANFTVVKTVSGSNGTASAGLIPLGSFQAAVTYLGTTTTVSGSGESADSTRVTTALSYPLLVLIVLIVAACIGVAFFVRRKSGRSSNPTAAPQTVP